MNCLYCEINSCNVGDIGDEEAFIQLLKNHGCIRQMMFYPDCGSQCKEITSTAMFRCQKTRVVDGIRIKCNFRQSMRTGTWFRGTRLSFKKVCQFLCAWLTIPHSRHDYIMKVLVLSSEAVVDWSNYCREICLNSLDMLDAGTIGGPGCIVEVDEAKFGKSQYNVGRLIEGSWIFGAFERESKRCFFETVEDRSAESLLEVISRRIASGTTIMSDLWRGYMPLTNHQQFLHLTVNHRMNFVDPVTGAHTQHIERSWREVRSKIPRFGRKRYHNGTYLAEYYWKSNHDLNSRFHNFLLEIARQHDPNRL